MQYFPPVDGAVESMKNDNNNNSTTAAAATTTLITVQVYERFYKLLQILLIELLCKLDCLAAKCTQNVLENKQRVTEDKRKNVHYVITSIFGEMEKTLLSLDSY